MSTRFYMEPSMTVAGAPECELQKVSGSYSALRNSVGVTLTTRRRTEVRGQRTEDGGQRTAFHWQSSSYGSVL